MQAKSMHAESNFVPAGWNTKLRGYWSIKHWSPVVNY